jgi:hypothetical protein
VGVEVKAETVAVGVLAALVRMVELAVLAILRPSALEVEERAEKVEMGVLVVEVAEVAEALLWQSLQADRVLRTLPLIRQPTPSGVEAVVGLGATVAVQLETLAPLGRTG